VAAVGVDAQRADDDGFRNALRFAAYSDEAGGFGERVAVGFDACEERYVQRPGDLRSKLVKQLFESLDLGFGGAMESLSGMFWKCGVATLKITVWRATKKGGHTKVSGQGVRLTTVRNVPLFRFGLESNEKRGTH
jgi:hypothetical protein